MTNHDKNDYKGPSFVRNRKTVPEPWEIELERERFLGQLGAIEQQQVEQIRIPNRMDA